MKAMKPQWSTTMPEFEAITKAQGLPAWHNAIYFPDDWPGTGGVVALLIPEFEVQLTASADLPTVIQRYPGIALTNKNIREFTEGACERAMERRTAIAFCCDTEEQLRKVIWTADKVLRKYNRHALERLVHGKNAPKDKLD